MNFFDLNKKQVGLFLFVFFLFFLIGSSNVPVLDRDEARFASASKDMIYNNEYIDITIGEEKRYKKPIGIYWAQIFSNKLFSQEPYTEIIFYRLPSVVGLALSLFLIFSVPMDLRLPRLKNEDRKLNIWAYSWRILALAGAPWNRRFQWCSAWKKASKKRRGEKTARAWPAQRWFVYSRCDAKRA